MDSFEIYPAIDLRCGKVVRLKQGDPEKETRYEKDPANAAERWIRAGARWLHLVNLDGAFGETSNHTLEGIRAVIAAAQNAGVAVQFGGGVRSLEDIQAAIDLGMRRVILGTAAIQQPQIMRQAVDCFGAASVVVGIDVRDGLVQIHGWQETTHISAIDLGGQAAESGVQTVIYTNIARDGIGTGVDITESAVLQAETGLKVIASGGVASLTDIERVQDSGLAGVIIGRALYDGQIDLEKALDTRTERS